MRLIEGDLASNGPFLVDPSSESASHLELRYDELNNVLDGAGGGDVTEVKAIF